MKILQINCVYGEGSTGKITRDIHEGLIKREHESSVIYGRGKRSHAFRVKRIGGNVYGKINNGMSRVTGIMYGGCYFSTAAIIREIKKQKPDIVHIQCINGYFCNVFKLLKFLKKSKISTVITLHAEFMYTANCGHAGECSQWMDGCKKCPVLRKETKSLFCDRTGYSWKRMHEIYQDWHDLTVVGCSEWICSRARMSGGFRDKEIVCVHNGIDNTSVFYPRNVDTKKLLGSFITGDEKIILYVAPSFSMLKGFDFFMELVHSCRTEPYKFVLVGSEFEIREENAICLGKVYDQNKLAEIYSAADVLVMCSRNDNYPTVCLEANSCGTPVVGFDVGGVKETISNGMGGVVDFARVDLMKEKIKQTLECAPDEKTVHDARVRHSKETMIDNYVKIYESILKRKV